MGILERHAKSPQTLASRINNPDYWAMCSVFLGWAAQYGYAGVSGYAFFRKWVAELREPGDPRKFLAMGCWLAETNRQATIAKLRVIDYLKEINWWSEEQERKVLQSWVRPEKGTVNFPEPEYYISRPKNLITERFDQKLPLWLPEHDLHVMASLIGINYKVAETVGREKFLSEYYPRIQLVFGELFDTESVFLNPREAWG